MKRRFASCNMCARGHETTTLHDSITSCPCALQRVHLQSPNTFASDMYAHGEILSLTLTLRHGAHRAQRKSTVTKPRSATGTARLERPRWRAPTRRNNKVKKGNGGPATEARWPRMVVGGCVVATAKAVSANVCWPTPDRPHESAELSLSWAPFRP